MDPIRIWPILNDYFRTNYFTAILFLVIAAAFFFKFLPGASRLKIANPTPWLLVICLAGAVLRIGWISISHYQPAFRWGDAQTIGKNLIEPDNINIHAADLREGVWMRDAEGKPTTRRPIGYPDLLGAFYVLFGANLTVFYGLNFFLFFCTVILIYLLASDLFDRETGIFAALLFSLYPISVYSQSLALDEHLLLPLWYFGLFLLFRQIKGRPVRWALLWYGVIFGYATMTRTHAFFMPLVVGFVYFLTKNSWKKILISVIVVYGIGQVMILPWVIRNYKIWGVYVPYTATNHDVYHGCNPSVRSGDNNGHWPQPGEPGYNAELSRAITHYDVPKIQRLGSEEVFKYIRAQPLDFMILGIEKWLHFMGTTRKTGVWAIDLMEESKHNAPELLLKPSTRHFFEEWAFGAYYVVFYLFLLGTAALAGSWKKISDERQHLFMTLGLCFMLYLGEHFILYPERKYRFPLEPFMIIMAASFISKRRYAS